MNIWIITDTHFGHKALREYCGRPDNADSLMLGNLSVCREEDMLIHLGDVCIGSEDEWNRKFCESVAGKKILVRGNHDRKSIGWYLLRGWDAVVDRLDIKMFGYTVAFSHIPLIDNGSFDINIHGHFHNKSRYGWEPELAERLNSKHVLVFVEHTYRPVSLSKIIKEYNKLYR